MQMNRIRPNLWFDTQGEEVARFYTGIFKDARLGAITHYPAAGQAFQAMLQMKTLHIAALRRATD